ncbi:MAG: hypothetical protein MZV70_53250 [Desulfobacterales bacterium]|nr:hypothetical protein [Desulfobacterales bacterium]
MRAALAARPTIGWVLAAAALMLAATTCGRCAGGIFWRRCERVDTASLFSALLIGYAANTFMPAHLGEFLRALVIGKKKNISGQRRLRLHRGRAHRGRDIADRRDGARHHRPPVPGVGGAQRRTSCWPGSLAAAAALIVAGKRCEAAHRSALVRVRGPAASARSRPAARIAGRELSRAASCRSQSRRTTRSRPVLSIAIWAVLRGGVLHLPRGLPLGRHLPPGVVRRGWWCSCSPPSASSSPPPRATSGPITTSARSRWSCLRCPASEALSFAVVAHLVSVVPVSLAGLVCRELSKASPSTAPLTAAITADACPRQHKKSANRPNRSAPPGERYDDF